MALTSRLHIINLPRVSRPRGLGYTREGKRLAGLGTWVVDTEYGLGPRFRQGFPAAFPAQAIPTRWPRAMAARVMGPSNYPVVARPFAATRLATTAYPVRKAPVLAPGAAMRNPGVAGFGANTLETLAEGAQTLKDAAESFVRLNVLGLIAGGTVAALAVRPLLPAPAKPAAAAGGLGAVGWGLYNFWQEFQLRRAQTAPGSAAALRTGQISQQILAKPSTAVTRQDKRVLISAVICYENARRAQAKGAARDPLKDCGLTEEQAARLVTRFQQIPYEERYAEFPGAFGRGGSLQDLGPFHAEVA